MREKKQALAEVNSRIAVLRSQRGLPAAMFEFNPNKAVASLLELEGKPNTALAPTALTAPVVTAPAAKSATTLDAGILTASLTEFRAMTPESRLQFAQDHGALSHTDFSALSVQAKMEHCRNGGQVMTENRRARCTLAASFGGNS